MNRAPLRPITEDEIRAYDEDGVVCIRGQFDADWTDHMLAACLSDMESPAARQLTSDDKTVAGRLVAASHMARKNDVFMDFVTNSPAAEIAARLMGLTEARFFYDQLFIKEPGTLAPTAWHHDLPFWPLDGNHVASVWLALTPVTRETSGLVYVAGSHKWGKMYRPVPAVNIDGFNLAEAEAYEECPMFHKEFGNPDYRFLDWDMEPGDCLVHHPLAVHGAGKNASNDQIRVALSSRFFGGDITWHGHRTKFLIPGTGNEGAFEVGALPANDDVFPVVWRG
jgi:ectoine hydroxylase-related dioxygenase (phytanoyl-CoA dioxygenase family)